MDKLLEAVPAPYRGLIMSAVCGGIVATGYFEADARVSAAETKAAEAVSKIANYEQKADAQRQKINEKIDSVVDMLADTKTQAAVTKDQVDNLKETAARSEHKLDQLLEIELRRGR